MVDMILSPLVDFLISTLASKLIEKGLMICQVGDDVDALSDKLSRIRNLLADAEARQIIERSVKRWLGKLKDVAYDADDVLDEIAFEALRQEAEVESNKRKRKLEVSFFSPLFDSKQEMANRIKEINERMEKIHKAKEILSLREGDHGRRASEQIDQRRLTTSLLTISEFEIYGRDKDREEIINMLLSEDDGIQASLISIVGMGGLGKTTLAQLVYNNPNVKNYFEIRAWVFVSEDFDVSRLTKELIESAIRNSCNSSSLDHLQRDLLEILRGKRFLIVLDDVWNDSTGAWERLAAPFRVGAKGSKIIVTTRSDKVSTAMNTDHPYHLKGLRDEDCLSLFLLHAFPSDNPDEINQELKKIGMELVHRRCDGLPLAAKTLGGLLSSKRDLNFWQSILNSQLWSSMGDESEVMKALRVSYYHLPPHFKQCFAFCSIFPKDHEFEKDNLVQLWMAQGFIQPIPGTTFSTLEEEIGSEYFDFLLSRSFFQVETAQWPNNRIYYKMHDCIHDLAMLVSSDECFRIEHGKPTPSPINGHRHSLFIADKDTDMEDFHHLYRCMGLRTFIFDFHEKIGVDMNQVIRDLNTNLRCLRVLVLKSYDLIELPNSISNLKHLRYLDLSSMKITQLPESVSSLYNLQTLNLSNCHELCQLPKETRKLMNLRHLNLDGCQSLESMPSEMRRLSCLQTLPRFIVGREKGCGIGELKGLTALKGAIQIRKLDNVLSNAKEAEEANLKDKHIEQLELEWVIDNFNGEDEACTNMQQVLEALQPPKNIKTLSIKGYGGKNYPTWLQDEKLPNLEDLSMWGLRNCNSFPPLGQFRRLKSLDIGGTNGVKCIGREFYGDGDKMKGFPSLEVMKIQEMHDLEEWCEPKEGAFPALQRLVITECPKLTKMPNNFSTLKHLKIVACHQLECLPKCPSLVELRLGDSNENLLRWVSHLTSLSTLRIEDFEELKSLPEDMLQPLVNLEELRIGWCEMLVSFIEEDNGLPPSLRSLRIWACPNIKSMPKGLRSLTSLKDLYIEYCPQLLSLPEEGLPTSLQNLRILGCPKLSERCRKGDGEDWAKISHIPNIRINGETIS